MEQEKIMPESIEILEGENGIKVIMDDIIKVGKEWCAFGSSGKAIEILGDWVDYWEEERQKNEIKLRAIIDTSPKSMERGNELMRMKNTEVRCTNDCFHPSSTWIYGGRIAIIVWSKSNPFAIKITSEEVVKSYMDYFEILWESARKF